MYVKTITIDGFKSYQHRTVVGEFDPSFNAITGLNGSGKSNILDSICFVLGITNLTQVRAANLHDLVYKAGQAGVHKATVSIVFDNTNKAQSPVGYAQYDEITVTRQVVIGGRNKYLINGVNAQNGRVADLFRSVQLNVNNPHFLIMQGRITKVLNMKPPEILSMIEEAAGTKMYESKKQQALKTIQKKETKLAEMDKMLEEEITPTLEKLKNDRARYLEFQGLQQEIERFSRLTVAYDYVRLLEHQNKSKEVVTKIRDEIAELRRKMEENTGDRERLKNEIKELEQRARTEATSGRGDSLTKLEEALAECQRSETVAATALEHRREALKDEEKKYRQLSKRLDDETRSLANKIQQLETIGTSLVELEERAANDLRELEVAQNHLQALSTGVTAAMEGGENATANAQLMSARDELAKMETDHKSADMKLKVLRPELKKRQTTMGRAEADYSEAKKMFDKGTEEIERVKARMAQLGYVEGSDQALRGERRQLTEDGERSMRQTEEIDIACPRLKFEYHDPMPNFDRSSVKGVVAKLIRLKNPDAATAIEVAAGDRLYNIIVENEIVAKQLLEKGQLRNRVTMIPLNKISAQPIPREVIRRAKALVGDENVDSALDLIEYPPELQRAMEYVFGGTFICKDMDVAKRVTFDPSILRRSVTLRGESFDPQGTLTGGSRPQTTSVVKRLYDMGPAAANLANLRRRIDEIDHALRGMGAVADEHRQLKERSVALQRDVDTAKMRLEGTSHHRQLEEIQQMQTEIVEAEETLQKCAEALGNGRRRIDELEERVRNADKYRAQEMKQAETRLKEAKRRHEQSDKAHKQKQEGTDNLKLETQELQVALESYKVELGEMEKKAQTMKEELVQLNAAWDETKEASREAQERVEEKRESNRARDEEIVQRQNDLERMVKENREAEMAILRLEKKEDDETSKDRDGAKRLQHIISSYNWIRSDERFFGQPGTAYDFAANNPEQAKRQLLVAQERKEQLQKTVNMRAMQLLGKAEEQYNQLLEKKEIVSNDKSKIEAVIGDLDEKKRATIEKAWAQVNRDFGSIFSTLLPGAKAKLEPPNGLQTAMEGLEVRVGFGDVWKESLQELSGGQRSLVALSLILAMLLFKPAPIYILDEVDAALDLSHTQNIGQMLKTHFKHSQFIVVSLKDGMFSNANVLFRTKFVDNSSTVTRHAQQS